MSEVMVDLIAPAARDANGFVAGGSQGGAVVGGRRFDHSAAVLQRAERFEEPT